MYKTDYTMPLTALHHEEAKLSGLTRAKLISMRQAGEELLACYAHLARSGRNLLQEVIEENTFTAWEHYPCNDVLDGRRHYFYHAHSADDGRSDEHGHFHLFVRLSRLKRRPWIERGISHSWRDDAPTPPSPEPLVHLLALSINAQGVPIRLFTTNQWVTGETLYTASDVRRLLRRYWFKLHEDTPLITRALSALLRLYEPKLDMLLKERDAKLRHWAARHRGKTATQHDHRLELCSSCDITPDTQIQLIAKLCSSR